MKILNAFEPYQLQAVTFVIFVNIALNVQK